MTINLRKRLQNKECVIIDGAMGTEILHRGYDTKLPLWSAEVLLTNPEVVRDIHEDYIKAGADVIVTNTFSTTRRSYAKEGYGDRAEELTLLACDLAKQARDAAADGREVWIAGSVAPLEDCYSPELTPAQEELDREHLEFAKILKKGGVDFILIETMITLREIKAALEAARSTGLPVAVSVCCNKDGDLLGGETLQDFVALAEQYDPLFIGVNCVSPAIATKVVKQLKGLTERPVSVYAQGEGTPDDDQGWKFDGLDPEDAYVRAAKEWHKDGAQLIGSCCGSNPHYTQRLHELLP